MPTLLFRCSDVEIPRTSGFLTFSTRVYSGPRGLAMRALPSRNDSVWSVTHKYHISVIEAERSRNRIKRAADTYDAVWCGVMATVVIGNSSSSGVEGLAPSASVSRPVRVSFKSSPRHFRQCCFSSSSSSSGSGDADASRRHHHRRHSHRRSRCFLACVFHTRCFHPANRSEAAVNVGLSTTFCSPFSLFHISTGTPNAVCLGRLRLEYLSVYKE